MPTLTTWKNNWRNGLQKSMVIFRPVCSLLPRPLPQVSCTLIPLLERKGGGTYKHGTETESSAPLFILQSWEWGRESWQTMTKYVVPFLLLFFHGWQISMLWTIFSTKQHAASSMIICVTVLDKIIYFTQSTNFLNICIFSTIFYFQVKCTCTFGHFLPSVFFCLLLFLCSVFSTFSHSTFDRIITSVLFYLLCSLSLTSVILRSVTVSFFTYVFTKYYLRFQRFVQIKN
jgi:hypothetical protein